MISASDPVQNLEIATDLVHVEDEIELADILEALVQRLNENLYLQTKDDMLLKDFLILGSIILLIFL